MLLAFEPTEAYGQTYVVSTGEQRLGRVSYEQLNRKILVTRLNVEPYLERFDIESRILDALLANDDVDTVQIVSSLSMASYYEEAGFECDTKQILLTKRKS